MNYYEARDAVTEIVRAALIDKESDIKAILQQVVGEPPSLKIAGHETVSSVSGGAISRITHIDNDLFISAGLQVSVEVSWETVDDLLANVEQLT